MVQSKVRCQANWLAILHADANEEGDKKSPEDIPEGVGRAKEARTKTGGSVASGIEKLENPEEC
jgi:hypothetical protein